jgi:hypothetical protein
MLFVSNFTKSCIFWYCTVPVPAIELYLDVRSRIEDHVKVSIIKLLFKIFLYTHISNKCL